MTNLPRYGLSCFDLRKNKREKIFEPGAIEDGGGKRRAHVLDFSATGALAYAETPPVPGNILVLRFAGQALAGRVAWVENRHFGFVFAAPLSAEAVDRVRRFGHAAAAA